MLKSRLQKTEGLKYTDLKTNIASVLRNIPKQNYEVLMKDQRNMYQKIKHEREH
jgi:hypothetical protein